MIMLITEFPSHSVITTYSRSKDPPPPKCITSCYNNAKPLSLHTNLSGLNMHFSYRTSSRSFNIAQLRSRYISASWCYWSFQVHFVLLVLLVVGCGAGDRLNELYDACIRRCNTRYKDCIRRGSSVDVCESISVLCYNICLENFYVPNWSSRGHACTRPVVQTAQPRGPINEH